MKRPIFILFIALLFGQILTLLFVCGAEAAIETRNYGWTLGKYDTYKKIFTPSDIDEFQWAYTSTNSMRVRTIGPWSVNQNFSINRVGSIISFVDKNRPEDNGYPMVGESQWDQWITQFKGNKDFVRDALDTWNITTPSGTFKFANFSQLVELCGGKGLSYSIANASSVYLSSEPPYATLLANKTSLKAGEAVTFTIRGQSNTYYSQFIDLSFYGAGQTIWADKRFTGPRVDTTYSYTFNTPGTYTFSSVIRDSVWRSTTSKVVIAVGPANEPTPPTPSQPPSDPPPDEPMEESNQDPTARFSWPIDCYEGDTVEVIENSYDRDGKIVDWRWRFTNSTGVTHNLAQSGGQVTFQNLGTYELRLTVEDDDGATDSVTKSILVIPPVPTAIIDYTGSLKENRKVVLDSAQSRSPARFPIDHSKDEWTIEPVSGGVYSDIKYGQKNGSTQEVLFKKAGTYKVGLKVVNAKHESEWVYKEIVIVPDIPPVADFIVPTIVFREPLDQSYAIIQLTDKSYSLDDDVISEHLWKYKFDSNNNGDFSDELWQVLDGNNNTRPYLRINHVGQYLFELEVKETFGQLTIPELITDSDYLRDNTDDRPLAQKIADVKNLAPVTSFKPTLKSKADIQFIVQDYGIGQNRQTLTDKINTYIKPMLNSKNLEVITNIIDDIEDPNENLAADPSFENSGSFPSTNWKNEVYIGQGGSITTSGVKTGSRALYLSGTHDPYAVGQTQKLSGWAPGDKLVISGQIKMAAYNYGQLSVDLMGLDSGGNVVYDSIGFNLTNSVSSSYVLHSSGIEKIPSNVTQLYVRIFYIGQMGVYIDDVRVRKANLTLDAALNEPHPWQNNAKNFIVHLANDKITETMTQPVIDNYKTKLAQDDLNYVLMGTDTNKAQGQTLISSNAGKGTFIYNTVPDTALNNLTAYMVSSIESQPQPEASYILLTDTINNVPDYSDYEGDPKFQDAWSYVHQPTYVDNNNGISIYHGKTRAAAVSAFDKYGKYEVYYKAQDEPTGNDSRFANYRLWSDPAPISIIVHRKPVAGFTVQPGTLYITDTSYDPDFQFKRPDKGIVEWYWKWKKTTDTNWTLGKPTGITQLGDYYFYLMVKDNYGVWSDPYQMAITVTNPNRPPIADFTWTPAVIYEGDTVTLSSINSYDPEEGYNIERQWTIFDPSGTTLTDSRGVFKTRTLTNVKAGTYWVTLRAWDSKGATDVITKPFSVNTLSVNGSVAHTPQWDLNRKKYNRNATGTDNSPRGSNMFWAGEQFNLQANTTDTTTSATKAQTLTATLLSKNITVNLVGNDQKTVWTGFMWQDTFENLADGNYKFIFTATYSNGTVKTCEVPIVINGGWQEYYKFHRSW